MPMNFERLRHELASAPSPSTGDTSPRIVRDEARFERAYSRRSLASSRALLQEALNAPCPEHDTCSGAYCWPYARGLCWPRFEAALTRAPMPPLVSEPPELEPAATAVRQVHRNQRLRARRSSRPGATR